MSSSCVTSETGNRDVDFGADCKCSTMASCCCPTLTQLIEKTGRVILLIMENSPKMKQTRVACIDQQLHVIVPAHMSQQKTEVVANPGLPYV